jgi:STE24 endopeptidase
MIALPAHNFTVLFLSLLALMLLTEITLARRHIRHVQRFRNSVPSAFREKIPLSAHQKAADYTVAKTRFAMLQAVFGAVLLVVWTVGGGLDLLDSTWRALSLPPLMTGTGFIFSVVFIGALLELPLSVYHTFGLEARFGFNKMTPRLYVTDLIKKTLLSLVLGLPLVLAVLWVMDKMGTLWWFDVWLLWTGFSVVMLWAYPALIAPLFNRFKPLGQTDLLQRIQALLDRTGFKTRGVFVMDGSTRSAHGNAYFTGLGKNKRIVFFDTLLGSLNENEIEAVLAHELGHFKRRHVLKRALLIFTGGFAGLAVLGWLIHQPWFYAGLGLTHASTYGALILFLLVGPVFTFFLQPLFAWGSRRHEYEADDFAAEQAEPTMLISALVKLYEENASTLTPDPWHSAFYDSHPPAAARIAHLQALA